MSSSLGTVVSLNQSYVEVLFDNNWKVCFGKRNFTVDRRDIPGKTTDVWQIPIRPAYAITIHKSQGSEYPAVIIPLLTGPRMLFNRNILYTSVTRAKNCVALVGSDETIQRMIQNKSEQNRFSSLSTRIMELSDHIQGGM